MKVLKFYADWCGPCKMLSRIVEDAGDKITIPFEDVNIDTDMMTGVQFGVRGVPTMVMVDDSGKEIKRKVGMMNEKDLLAWLQP